MSKPVVATVGLPSTHERVPVHMQEMVHSTLQMLEVKFKNTAIDYHTIFCAPEPSQETASEESINKLIAELESIKVNLIIIGAGLRLLPPQTPFFEQLMNVLPRRLPNARLGFNTDPASTRDAILRVYPDLDLPVIPAPPASAPAK